jgi:hypothetical protein
MSLFVPGLSRFDFTFDNLGVDPSTNLGTSVIPGASNAEGSWTQVASAANVAQDIYGLWIRVSDGVTGSQAKPHLLDIGIDPAGGTAYVQEIANICCGNSSVAGNGGGHEFYFPYFIKAGSSVAVRIQGANATAGTVRVQIKLYGFPTRPELVPKGSFSETIGTITNSNGVSFTPGTSADGTWVSLGTTAKAMWWWQIAYQLDNATVTNEQTYIDLAHGDATNKHIIQRIMHSGLTTEDIRSLIHTNLIEGYCEVPAGAEMWVRGRANSAPDTGYNAVAVGIGG